MSEYKRLTFDETGAGLHWAKSAHGAGWDLVRIRISGQRRIHIMGWDCGMDPADCESFIKAEFVTPDGKPYET